MSRYDITAHRLLGAPRYLTCIAPSPKAAALIGTMAYPGFLITVQAATATPFLPSA